MVAPEISQGLAAPPAAGAAPEVDAGFEWTALGGGLRRPGCESHSRGALLYTYAVVIRRKYTRPCDNDFTRAPPAATMRLGLSGPLLESLAGKCEYLFRESGPDEPERTAGLASARSGGCAVPLPEGRIPSWVDPAFAS